MKSALTMMLKDIVKQLPDSPGIYQYFDQNRKLLYIGKAKSLKNRVKNYFKFSPSFSAGSNLSPRIFKMICETKYLEYIVVDSEHDALILENSLIKQLKPKYNILLRDDKTYPYIYIDLAEDFPRFEMTRKVIKGRKIKYFGPFSTSAREIYNALYDLFPLVQKKGCLKSKKACLFYQIKKCLAPCEGKVASGEYKRIVKDAVTLINDKDKLVKILENKMLEYSENLLFEEAAATRDKIEKIKKSLVLTNVDLAKLEDFDIFTIDVQENRACAVRMFIREGKIISSSHSIFKSDNGFDKDELYKRTLLEYYLTDIPVLAKNILLYEEFNELEIIKEVLSKKFEKKINITIPQRGEKRNLTALAYKNTRELLKLQDQKNEDTILIEIKKLFNLEKTPYNIEIFDNSHMMGAGIVGAMVKWENGFIKNAYRHYNLNSKDEYAQMKELLQKRCESFYKNSPPDLWIIDGGRTLLNLAIQTVKQNNAFVDIIAIAKEKRDLKAQRAKGKAKDIIYTQDEIFTLSVSDKRLQFVQQMRDEAHRFALSFHKKQKLKADKEVNLLKKRGIGEATIKKLLQYFETFENIEKASFEELQQVIGIKIAENLKK